MRWKRKGGGSLGDKWFEGGKEGGRRGGGGKEVSRKDLT